MINLYTRKKMLRIANSIVVEDLNSPVPHRDYKSQEEKDKHLLEHLMHLWNVERDKVIQNKWVEGYERHLKELQIVQNFIPEELKFEYKEVAFESNLNREYILGTTTTEKAAYLIIALHEYFKLCDPRVHDLPYISLDKPSEYRDTYNILIVVDLLDFDHLTG